MFCLFVEDIGLLPDRVFADIIEEAIKRPDDFEPMLRDLFRAMREDRGRFGMIPIPWFNGGLFDDDDVLPLGFYEVRALADAAKRDWSYIDPSIFGTLFEKGLDPARRKEMANLFDATRPADDGPGPQLPGLLDSPAADKGVGIHYTDPDTIMKLIEPVVLRPLRAEWQAVKDRVRERRAAKDRAKSDAARTRMENEARDAWMRFRRRLGEFRVLDPACGSGNFLYLALAGLKDLDQEVLEEGRALDLPDDGQRITPESVLGIEINPYAAELARVTIWIGELQWQFGKGLQITRRPILDQLRGIECRDALIGPDGNEARWPGADAIVGNPPFLGTKRMIRALGEEYTKKLRQLYTGRVSPFSDLVCWWFEKAGEIVSEGNAIRAGLVATNSIRGGKNRLVLDKIGKDAAIYEAWADQPWVIDSAAVRVSLICFAPKEDVAGIEVRLDGQPVLRIHPDLTATTREGTGSDLTNASQLNENRGTAFVGTVKSGAFDITGKEARTLLQLPLNPNGLPNSDVIRRWANGRGVVRRPQDKWIIDFGIDMPEAEAALFEEPFAIVVERVKSARSKVRRRPRYRDFWPPRRSKWIRAVVEGRIEAFHAGLDAAWGAERWKRGRYSRSGLA